MDKKRIVIQLIKFCLVGLSNTLVSFFINIGMLVALKKFELSFDYMIANVVAFFLSVLWSFYWNERFVFTQNRNTYQSGRCLRLIKMYLSYGFTGIILNNFLSYIWISILGISKAVAPLINSAVGIPINYVINKKWTFEE